MKKTYSTTLEENTLKTLKIQAIEEIRAANEILEEALKDYFKKKGIEIETKK